MNDSVIHRMDRRTSRMVMADLDVLLLSPIFYFMFKLWPPQNPNHSSLTSSIS